MASSVLNMTEQSSKPAAQAANQSTTPDVASEPTNAVAATPDAAAPAGGKAPSETDASAGPVTETVIDAKQAETDQATLEAADSADIEATQQADQPAKKRVRPQEVISRLIAAWPLAFFSEPRSVKPLAIGVLQQILSDRPAALDGLNSQAIRSGLKFYTSRLSYHYGMVHNTHRITLTGEPADEVDDKAREYARAQIVAIKQLRDARQAAQNPPATEGEEQGTDDASQGKRQPRAKQGRKPRAARGAERVKRDENTGEPSGRQSRRSRRDQPRTPRADKLEIVGSQADGQKAENLSMEEKLARLAQHFGKSG